jgi:hypothetical protein
LFLAQPSLAEGKLLTTAQLVTGWVQSFYYSVTIRAGDARPQPGTARYAEHRRRIHILVVSAYLLYTIYEADFELRRASSFYADLSVPTTATEREIKTRFRRLAALHHPDKVASDDANASNYFLHLKTASDTLLDPARRFAYDRFGPEVVEWQHCKTIRDYVGRGAQQLIPYYGVAAAFMYALGLLGYLDWGRFERWLVLVIMFVFELHTVTRPNHPAFLSKLLNPLLSFWGARAPYLPFQAILLARKLSITIYIAFSQIGPMLAADTSQGKVTVAQKGNEETVVRQSLERLEITARSLDADAGRLLDMEMAPFAGDETLLKSMRGKVKEWLVQNTIRSDPMVRDALGRSFQRRRIDAPAGARGNR